MHAQARVLRSARTRIHKTRARTLTRDVCIYIDTGTDTDTHTDRRRHSHRDRQKIHRQEPLVLSALAREMFCLVDIPLPLPRDVQAASPSVSQQWLGGALAATKPRHEIERFVSSRCGGSGALCSIESGMVELLRQEGGEGTRVRPGSGRVLAITFDAPV